MNNYRMSMFLPVLAVVLSSILLLSIVPVGATASPTVLISNFNVTPYNAALGTRVTAHVTLQNLDMVNPVSLTVTLTDGGIAVASSKQPLTLPAGGSASTSFQFKTVTGPSHCYLVTTTPSLAISTGYCEAGNLLGGTVLAVNALAILIPYLGLAGIAVLGVFGIVSLKRRKGKNQ